MKYVYRGHERTAPGVGKSQAVGRHAGVTRRGRRAPSRPWRAAIATVVMVVVAGLVLVSVAMATSIYGSRMPTSAEVDKLDGLRIFPPRLSKLGPGYVFQDIKDARSEQSVLSVVPGPGTSEFTIVANRPVFPHSISNGCRLDLFNNRKAICPASGSRHFKFLLGDLNDALILSFAGNGFVWVDAGTGNDFITTGASVDLLEGSAGNDVLSAGANDDYLLGGAGNDILLGGTGDDLLRGDTGVDTVSYKSERKPVTVTIDDRADDGISGEEDNVTTSVENVIGGRASDTITGSSANNTLQGMNGNDTLDGGGGLDTLDGGGGNDIIRAKDGVQDRIICGSGIDIVYFDVGIDLPAADCEILNP